jgi:hypothetical protein
VSLKFGLNRGTQIGGVTEKREMGKLFGPRRKKVIGGQRKYKTRRIIIIGHY